MYNSDHINGKSICPGSMVSSTGVSSDGASAGIQLPSRRLFLTRSAILTLVVGSASTAVLGTGTARAATREERREVGDRGPQKANFLAIQQHENDHVAFLVAALGGAARPKPTFQNLLQNSYADFVLLSQTLENTGVGAYLGAAPNINNSAVLAGAGSIATIEARHSGYLNTLLHDPITANSMDDDANPSLEGPLTAAQVVAGAGAFIASLNGGPPVDYSTTKSDANDIDILNFALALEYLESEYYNLNVPKFYGHHKR